MNPPSSTGNLPLQEFRRDVPPGWAPGDHSYPLRLYLEKLQLWYKTTSVEDEVVGPLIAGRLHGRAAKVAMSLRIPRPDGNVDIGPDALSRLSVDEVIDPTTGAVMQNAIASGVQYLMAALRQAFGQRDQDLATSALDKFFGLSRHSQKMSLAEYAVEFDTRYNEAQDRAGLQLNDVAKFYLWFKHSGLPAKTVDDIKLQVNGDHSRYDDARSLALRLSPNRVENDHDVFYGEYAEDEDAGYAEEWNSGYEDPEEAWWYGYGGYASEDPYADWDYDWYEHDDGYYHATDEDYYEDYYEEDPNAGYPAEGNYDGDTKKETDDAAANTKEEFYKGGKGKGKSSGGEGCFNCGSKWHLARDCPLPPRQGQGDGKGRGKEHGHAFGMRKGKGKGKGFGYRPYYKGKMRPKGFGNFGGKGKGKGYGKSYGKKGYGKGYGKHWFSTTPSSQRPKIDFSEGPNSLLAGYVQNLVQTLLRFVYSICDSHSLYVHPEVRSLFVGCVLGCGYS